MPGLTTRQMPGQPGAAAPTANGYPGLSLAPVEDQQSRAPSEMSSSGQEMVVKPSSSTHLASKGFSEENDRESMRSFRNGSNERNGSRPGLSRAKSDFGPRREDTAASVDEDAQSSTDGEFRIRHGWESQLTSEEYNNLLNSVRSMSSGYFSCTAIFVLTSLRPSSCITRTRSTRPEATLRMRFSLYKNGACAIG